jgi:hypothetical protein
VLKNQRADAGFGIHHPTFRQLRRVSEIEALQST